MTQALTTPTFNEEATALAEIPADSATSIATEPLSTPKPTPLPVTQRERIPTIDVVRGVALETPWWVLYQLGRLTGAVANVALVVVISKAGYSNGSAPRRCSGPNRAQQLPLHQHQLHHSVQWLRLRSLRKLEYYWLYAVVACVWLLNLTLSPIWLWHFQFGPMEWVWRSLTYWKRQPMRRCSLEEQKVLAA